MSELLGLIDSLEALVLEAPKIPMTDKVMLKETQLLQLFDKMRAVVKNSDTARLSVDANLSSEEAAKERIRQEIESMNNSNGGGSTAPDDSLQAKQKAKKVREGANDYAEYVLANLQLTLTKMQKNLIRLEKNIESGRDILTKQKQQLSQEGVKNET